MILSHLSPHSSVRILSVFVSSFFIVLVSCAWCILLIFYRRTIACNLTWLSSYCTSFTSTVKCRVLCRRSRLWINTVTVYRLSLTCWVSIMFVSMFSARHSAWSACGSAKHLILSHRHYTWIYRRVVILRWCCWGCCILASLLWLFILQCLVLISITAVNGFIFRWYLNIFSVRGRLTVFSSDRLLVSLRFFSNWWLLLQLLGN